MSSLRATFELSAADLAAGEDPPCQWTVRNEGSQVAHVPNPDLNGEWPRFVVQEVATGALRSFEPAARWAALRMKPMPDKEGDGPLTRLAPGEVRTWVANLSQAIELPLPGEYRVYAEFQTLGEVVRSTPAMLRVQAIETVRSDLTCVHDGFSDTFFQSYVGHPGLGLYLRAVRLRRSLRQLQCCRIARVQSAVEPRVSVAPNRAASATRSVSWLEGNVIHVVDVGLEGVTRPKRSLRLPAATGLLVPHPCMNPATDDTDALVWMEGDGATSLASLLFAERGIDALPPLAVPLPLPIWARSFFRSSGERVEFCLVAGAGSLGLYHLRLGEGSVDIHPVHALEWSPLATAAQLDVEDTVHGVVVGQTLADGATGAVVYRCWSFDQAGRFSTDAPRVWPDLDSHSLEHFQLAVDHRGTPHALVRAVDGQWACLTPDTWVAVAPPVGASISGSPMLRFMAGGRLPVVFWHDSHRGLLAAPVGSELPDYQGEDFAQPPLAER
jgi:hypothetical protein